MEEYNFGLEDGLDAEDLDRISDYQAAQQKQSSQRLFFPRRKALRPLPLRKNRQNALPLPMRNALLYQDNVYMMAELRKGTEGFEDYFKELGIEVEVDPGNRRCPPDASLSFHK